MKYYIINSSDAKRLGLTGFRQGNASKGYLVHTGDFICATEDFMERAEEVSETQAKNFIKSLSNE